MGLRWEQDPDTDDLFAWLKPPKELSYEAFYLAVEDLIINASTHVHERNLISLGKATPYFSLFFTTDD